MVDLCLFLVLRRKNNNKNNRKNTTYLLGTRDVRFLFSFSALCFRLQEERRNDNDRLRTSVHLDGCWPTRACTVYTCLEIHQPPLLSSASLPPLSLSLFCLQHYSLHLSLAAAGEPPNMAVQRPRSGLSTSWPWRGGPSSPQHGGAMALMALVTGRLERQAWHKWLPGRSSSFS
jgi:hypothetical protein